MAKLIVTGTGEGGFDGEYPLVLPSKMRLKALRVLQVQSGLKQKEFQEAAGTYAGQVGLSAFASLHEAGVKVTWDQVENLRADQLQQESEPGDDALEAEDATETAAGDEAEDPTPAPTDSARGDVAAPESEASLL